MRGGLESARSRETLDQAYSNLDTDRLRQIQGEPSAEELHYKSKSVDLLNGQLADPMHAKDDSVLATILVSCLYHVCNSGIAKFKTQLVGVQKLLKMREKEAQSDFRSFIELFFTWFDVMISTVNDRETQISGNTLDSLDFPAGQIDLEHVAGCEIRLFKIIVRLSRLNLLSQSRPVRNGEDHRPQTPRPTPTVLGYENKSPISTRDYYSLHPNPWDHLSLSPTPGVDRSDQPFDLHEAPTEFWDEWQSIRQQLQDWRPEVQPATAGVLSQNQKDLLHSSESFRYAALLYIERLAAPSSPPSNPGFQTLASQAIFHVSQIGLSSPVNRFLLWPLFVTGAECMDGLHRRIIRQRCFQIQRITGFANNLSSLQVLEKVWQDEDASQAERPRNWGRQSGRWYTAMDRSDGEYIVI